MKKTISFIRIAILLALGAVSYMLLFGKEQNDNGALWALYFVVDKALGIGSFLLIGILYKHWSKVDPWLKAYERFCDDVMEKENPVYLDHKNED